MAETLSPRALCSLEDVTDVLDITLEEDDARADRLVRLINAASNEVYDFTDREITSTELDAEGSGTAETVRVFDTVEYAIGRNLIEVGDMAAVPEVVEIKDWDGNLLRTVAAEDIDVFPRTRKVWEPIQYLRLRNSGLLPARGYVEVTAFWGFPAIPTTVRNDTIETVRLWADQISVHSATSEQDIQGGQPSRNLPPHVLVSLSKFRNVRG